MQGDRDVRHGKRLSVRLGLLESAKVNESEAPSKQGNTVT